MLRTGVSEIPIDLFLVLSNLSTSESSSYASSQQFQMTFAPSDTSRVVDIPIIDDVVDEEEDVEMFEVFLMEDMSSNRLSFVSATATVNILDDDNPVVKIECMYANRLNNVLGSEKAITSLNIKVYLNVGVAMSLFSEIPSV